MANKDDLSKRILRTKKESEELQAQLQKLIELGKSQSQNYVNAKLVEQGNENELNTNKVQIIKSYDPNYSKHINKPIPSKSFDKSKASCSSSNINPNVEPSKKTKCYDVNEAREYIKKQKEKRLKQQQTVNTAAADIRKKKLEELRKKSRELVARNVELTRARSKSRERKDYVRLDEFNKKGITGYVANNAVEINNPKKINVLSNIVLKSPDDSKHSTSRIPQPSINVPNLAEQDEHKSVEENSEQINVPSSIIQPQIDYKFEIIQNPSEKCNLESQDEYQIHKKKNCEKSFCDKDINIGNFKKEFPEWLKESPAQAYPFNFINTVKRKLQFVINSPKPTVDIGVQSTCPKNVDLLEPCVSYHSRKNEVVDSNRVSNLKSFKSHNYDNLDGKSIEHLELIPKKDKLYSDKVPSLVPIEFNDENHLVSKYTNTESESDTSKNIPEISSESGSSLHKNAESVRRNLNLDFEFINTEKIKDLKLKQPIKSTSTTIGSDIKYSPIKNSHKISKQSKILDNKYLKPPDYTTLKSLNDQYVSDFESPTSLKENINRSRESILSFNSPEFSKQIIKSPAPDKFSLKNNLSVKSEINNIPPTGIIQNLNCSNNSQNGSISNNSEVPPSSIISTNFDISKHVKSKTSKSILSVLPKSKRDKITEIILPREFMLTNNKENTVEEEVIKAQKLKTKSNDFPRSTLHNGNVSINLKPSKTISNSVSTNFEDSNASTAQSNSYIESGASVLSKSIKSQITTRRSYENMAVNEKSFDIPPLEDPDIFLIKNTHEDFEHKDTLIKNVSIRSKAIEDNKDSANVNEIHLKFEAEIHLLNDFNESLRKFSAAEKVFETLKNKNELVASNILQNRDTQTSIPKDSVVSNIITENSPKQKKSRSGISFINFSRGSFIDQSLSNGTLDNSVLTPLDESKTIESTNVRSSELSTSKIESVVNNESKLINFKNLQDKNFDGFTLSMFDLLIKDEDARLENLKTNLKIREKILLDRTRAELAWLEIQKKHFKETGNLQEACTVKKKQRAILLNHEKEKHEMQKLKQMRKAASAERKIILKQQRNLIRKQLSTNNMLGNMKVSTPRERRLSGPLKVIQSHTESILSETSVSRKSSSDRDKEVYSILSHHSVSKLSEVSEVGISLPKESQRNLLGVGSTKSQEHIKKTLLMREAVLKKRKEAAEELLQWHKQLLEEEQRIEELELKAASVISQKHSTNSNDEIDKHKFMGKQLNQLWFNLTGSKEKKFTEEKIYPMSQNALEQFCKSAREYSLKAKKVLKGNSSDYSDSSVSENIPRLKQSEEKESHIQKTISTNEYASDFEIESITNEKNVSVIENISELICNFGKIEDDILSLNFMHSKKSDEEKATNFRTYSDLDVSVIETNKDFKESDQSLPFKTTPSSKSSHIQSEIKDFSIITENVIEDEIPPKDTSAENEQNNSDLMKFEGTDQSINTDQFKVVNDEEKGTTVRTDSDLEVSMIETNKHFKESDQTLPFKTTTSTKSSPIQSQIKDFSIITENVIENEIPPKDTSAENEQNNSDLMKFEGTDQSINTDQSKVVNDEIRENLNDSKEILKLLGEPEDNIDIEIKLPSESDKSKENINTSEDILSTLTQKDSNVDSVKSSLISGSDELKKESFAATTLVEEIITKDRNDVNNTFTELNKVEVVTKEKLEVSPTSTSENTQESANIKSELESGNEDLVVASEAQEEIPSDIITENGKDIISAKLSSKIEVAIQSEKENNQINDISKKITPGSNGVSLHISNNIKQVTSIYFNSDINIDEVADTECNESLSEDSREHSEEKIKQKTDITPISGENEEKSNQISSINEVTEPNTVSAEKVKSPTKAAGVEDFPNGDLKYVKSKSEYESDIESNSVSNKIIEDSVDKDQIKTVVNGTALESECSPQSEIQTSIKEQSNSNISSIDNDQESQSIQDEVSMSSTGFKENNVDYVNSFESPPISSDSQIRALVNDKRSHSEKSNATDSSKHTSSGDKSPKQGTIDIKKRVLEILADANQGSRGDKSPRLQDLYVTTYDLVSPPISPDSVSGYPVNNRKLVTASSIFGNEAEEILKKQLAIEQEIKQITDQQQREQQIPFLYVREIPNKPPPPYTPPSLQPLLVNVATVIPSIEEVEDITKYSAKILYKAYLSNNLDNIAISENTLSLISKSIPKERYKFVFDVCKDLAKQYYKQFEEEKVPSWLQLSKKPHLCTVNPLDVNGLERHIAVKLKEILGYEKSKKRENAIIKWSRKKRDHVDEILVTECQTEEVQWTNYEKDELLVMDQLTNEIMNELIKETAERFSNIFSKRN